VSSGGSLRTEGLTRTFAGFRAVGDVTLEIPEGGVRTIIGPNGAGKTTLFNLLSGLLAPTAGRIFYGDLEITSLAPYRRARLGIARSFQITNIFGKLSVFENVRLAVAAVYDGKANFLFPSRSMRDVNETAERVLGDIGLSAAAGEPAETLSHGDQRRLEIGLVLATDPRILLLDEPLAGMSPTETQETVDLIGRIGGGRTIVLVEHDIDVVMRISTSIAVMQAGQILAIGTPQEIRENEAVRRAYLGDLA
jgi:branched-chain amino acid transport system ATP-binding protein